MSTYQTNGEIWPEEVAANGSPSHKILNGHIFALAGVYDYLKYTGDSIAEKIFEGGVKAVKNNLDLYDAGYTSYYSDINYKGKKPFAPRNGYHVVHVMQLLWLYDVTNDVAFLKKAMKFQAYEINYGNITVSSSVNAKTNGPSKMNLTFGNNYWSSSIFPVTIILDMLKEETLIGAGLLGHTKSTTPKSHLLEKSLDGESYQKIAKQVKNEDMRFISNFSYDVNARFLKFTVFSSNGKSLALDGIAANKKKPEHVVLNFCNYSVSVNKITDSKLGTSIPIRCEGFIIIPPSCLKSDSLCIYGVANKKIKGVSKIQMYESDNLNNWNFVAESYLDNKKFKFNDIDDSKYLKVLINENVASISEIIF